MSRVAPLKPDDLPELAEVFQPVIQRMGFLPTSLLVMARKPKLLRAFIGLIEAVYDPEAEVSLELKNLVGHMASKTAGCMYCCAHTGSNASRSGSEDAKIAALWDFERSDLFSEAERAALRFAMAAAQVPSGVTDDLFDPLRKHFSDAQIVELMAVIATFGYLNRWNDSMATALEEEPLAFAERTLADTDWQPGKHLAKSDSD